MKRRHSSRDAISIGDELQFQEALQECLDANDDFAKYDGCGTEKEKTTGYKMAEAAAGNAWNALTAMIDCYEARRISETLEKI